MIDWNDVLNEIISVIEPEHVSVSYIVMAKYTDQFGKEKTIRGKDLKDFMSDPEKTQTYEARIIVDVSKIKKFMIHEIVLFFETLDSRST